MPHFDLIAVRHALFGLTPPKMRKAVFDQTRPFSDWPRKDWYGQKPPFALLQAAGQ
jgi:hypothetical protein